MEITADIYKEIENQISVLVARKKELEANEIEKAKAEGWKTYERGCSYAELRNVDMVVIDTKLIEKNEMEFTLLCVNGEPDFHMKRFIYTVYLTNKHMLASKFKRGDLFNAHLIQAYCNIEKRTLLGGVIMYKNNETYVVDRLYVKKPGRPNN
jgi:hypothetical protein